MLHAQRSREGLIAIPKMETGSMTTPIMKWANAALSKSTILLSIRTALIVGPVLICINQWEALTGDAPLNLPKALLTFIVPYLVSTYSAASTLRKEQSN